MGEVEANCESNRSMGTLSMIAFSYLPDVYRARFILARTIQGSYRKGVSLKNWGWDKSIVETNPRKRV